MFPFWAYGNFDLPLQCGFVSYGGGRVPSVKVTFINVGVPFRLIVSMSVSFGCVCSSKYVERASPFIMLVPFMARIMSPPMGIVVPAIVTSCVPLLSPAASAGLLLRMPVISHPYVMFMFMSVAM